MVVAVSLLIVDDFIVLHSPGRVGRRGCRRGCWEIAVRIGGVFSEDELEYFARSEKSWKRWVPARTLRDSS